MVFVNEFISKEDETKYGHSSDWTIDREREVFLIASGIGREGVRTFKMFSTKNGALIANVNAQESGRNKIAGSKNPADGFTISCEIHSIVVTPAFQSDKSNILLLLKEAIIEESMGTPNKRFVNVEVEVIFQNQVSWLNNDKL